jgi:hypothetical protein
MCKKFRSEEQSCWLSIVGSSSLTTTCKFSLLYFSKKGYWVLEVNLARISLRTQLDHLLVLGPSNSNNKYHMACRWHYSAIGSLPLPKSYGMLKTEKKMQYALRRPVLSLLQISNSIFYSTYTSPVPEQAKKDPSRQISPTSAAPL